VNSTAGPPKDRMQSTATLGGHTGGLASCLALNRTGPLSDDEMLPAPVQNGAAPQDLCVR
jgi:hypothetical protein